MIKRRKKRREKWEGNDGCNDKEKRKAGNLGISRRERRRERRRRNTYSL